MSEDFYQRKVGAEYEEMDYDANEQFDDDDVDIGAEEIEDTGGYAEDVEDEVITDDEELEEEDGQARAWKEMLSGGIMGKEDGQLNPDGVVAGDPTGGVPGSGPGSLPSSPDKCGMNGAGSSPSGDGNTNNGTSTPENDTGASGMSPSNKIDASKMKTDSDSNGNPEMKPKSPAVPTPNAAGTPRKRRKPPAKAERMNLLDVQFETDENGDRILTQTAIRQEIWLHSGAMPFKKLKKFFNVKGDERKKTFIGICKELCTTRKDLVEGNMMVLKQHNAKNI